MKRFILLLLLLAMLLSLTACGTVTRQDEPVPDEQPPQEEEQQHLTAEVPETEVWQRRTTRRNALLEEHPVDAAFERISGAAEKGMTVGQELLLLDFAECYYQSVGALQVIDPAVLFATAEQTEYHKTIWRDLCVIRRLAPIDLTMTSYSFALRCEELKPSEETEDAVDIVLRESNAVRFAGLNGIVSEQLGIKHTFTLTRSGGQWLILKHTSDDNAYYSADYDPVTKQDGNFPAIVDYIAARRELSREETAALPTADHAYDRQAALQYMFTYVGTRNADFKAYDELGGNCMNFGSQVLLAGGIPMDETGGYDDGWYWYSENNTTLPWVNVGHFLEYAAAEREHGLVAVVNAPYFSGETGDIITMGVEEPANHTTVIQDTIKDGSGEVVDYLLCSNTADLRNFPASAYYYTNRQLTKIVGWND